jgi:methylated-DNA-[protein]-cysteine S-methyltransferase
MDLERALLETPIGTLELLVAPEGVRVLALPDSRDRVAIRGVAAASGPGAKRVLDRLRAYFDGDLDALATIPVAPQGTPFHVRVWEALRTIPVGTTCSYRELAETIGQPTAVRAVGLANGRNPVAIVIPCHRVIGADGTLVGYGGGLARKQWLLEHEGALPRRLEGVAIATGPGSRGARRPSRRGAAPSSRPRTPPSIR